MNRAHLASRIYGVPLMILPDKATIIASVVEGSVASLSDDFGELPAAARNALLGTSSRSRSAAQGSSIGGLPYVRTRSGVAVIPILGSLINRGSWIDAESGVSSYNTIGAQLTAATNDPETKSVLLDLDSPGGEAVGCFEVAQLVRHLRATKPVIASVNGLCCSAAYAIASGATKIITTPSSMVGSIGVVMLHADHSRRLEKAGIVPTLIHPGARKTDANPYQALSDEVKARLQDDVGIYFELFVETVATGRRALSPTAIRATEAGTYIGVDAVKVRLVDAIGTFDDALAELSGQPASPRTTSNVPGLTTASIPAPTHSLSSATERERILQILTCPEAEGRKTSAEHLALRTRLTVDQAIGALTTIPLDRPADGGRGPLGLKIANRVEEIYACHGKSR